MKTTTTQLSALTQPRGKHITHTDSRSFKSRRQSWLSPFQARRRLGSFVEKVTRSLIVFGNKLRPQENAARGDVPGWVLITLMSAVLVAGLLALAGPAFARLFNDAMSQVKP